MKRKSCEEVDLSVVPLLMLAAIRAKITHVLQLQRPICCMPCILHITAQIGMTPISAIFAQFAKCTNRYGARVDPHSCNMHTASERLVYNAPHMAGYN